MKNETKHAFKTVGAILVIILAVMTQLGVFQSDPKPEIPAPVLFEGNGSNFTVTPL